VDWAWHISGINTCTGAIFIDYWTKLLFNVPEVKLAPNVNSIIAI
jgi:hypothetical protein